MFSDVSENYKMLVGAYKKLKSYYHYNKNFLFMRKKIAEFEDSEKDMEASLSLLSNILSNPVMYNDKLEEWIEKIDFYVMPKSFKGETVSSEKFVTSVLQINKQINKMNFFIDMPIELHLIETVWTLFVGKLVFDNKIISDCCYGNVIDNYVVYNKEIDFLKSINFEKNKLFKIYFGQYCSWKNNAIDSIEKNKNNKSMALVSLDIKSFYYSVSWKFDLIKEMINDERYGELIGLTDILENIFKQYTNKIAEVRELKQNTQKREYVLPIGLFCSMLLANVYLSDFDKKMISSSNNIYYGRYVDDILLVLNVTNEKFECTDIYLNKLLIENQVLEEASNNYYICDHPELIVQTDKLKVIYFECGKAVSLIKQLKKTKIIPSQMNIVPDNDLKMSDFEEAAYLIEDFTTETKIRDVGMLEINRFKLGWHMAELVRNSKYSVHQLSRNEKINRQIEGEKILSFFVGSNVLEYSSNWINVLYFFMLNGSNHRDWKRFEFNVREAINKLRIVEPEAIKKGKSQKLKAKMKKQLLEQFNICISTALALNPCFYKKEAIEVKKLAYKLRKANLFNHYLVSYPLINFIESIDENLDLTKVDLWQLKYINFNIADGRKIELTPRFINLDELFQFAFLESICKDNDNTWHLSEKRIEFIRQVFFNVNKINENGKNPLQIKIKNTKVIDNYYMQEVDIWGKKIDLGKVRIAVASISLGIKDCCMGLENTEVQRNRTDFMDFLRKAYENKNGKVDFLLFPEFYLPLSWLSDVLSFVRKSGITIITGLQYIINDRQAHNTVGVFAQLSSGRYKSSCMIVREKNDYAPFEKKLLALKGYCCKDRKNPVYSIINCNGVRVGTFLCYEFTDIVARSLYKDKVDILFAPENNSDTTYFSNILETTTRDLHTFVVQSNTSLYGDSRIVGPYSRDQRNIIQIKGGDNDNIIIGTINIRDVQKNRLQQRKTLEKEICEFLDMNKKEKYEKEKELLSSQQLKISKISARTEY